MTTEDEMVADYDRLTALEPGCRDLPSVGPVHEWHFLSGHGQDAPGQSLDTYSQCSRCGAVKHDYAHGGGQTSPNYPMLYRLGKPIARDASCVIGLPDDDEWSALDAAEYLLIQIDTHGVDGGVSQVRGAINALREACAKARAADSSRQDGGSDV